MLTDEKLKELRELITKYGCDFISNDNVLELLDEIEQSRREINNFLTYGQGGASFKESQLLSKLYKAEAERNELRAQAAAIKEKAETVLENWEAYSTCLAPDEAIQEYGERLRDSITDLRKALSTDAGREMLGRMRKLEAVVKEAKTIAKWMKWWLDEDLCDCDTYHICGKPQRESELQNFEQALAALEKGE